MYAMGAKAYQAPQQLVLPQPVTPAVKASTKHVLYYFSFHAGACWPIGWVVFEDKEPV